MAKKIGKGLPLEELVKGSLDYTINLINAAFRSQFPYVEDGENYWIYETFKDYVIVRSHPDGDLRSDEYFKVAFTRAGDVYTFAQRADWEIVELTYQPQTSAPMAEAKGKKKSKQRFDERIEAQVQLEEANGDKGRRIKIQGAMTAGIINGNGRRYPAGVIESAVAELRSHLNESAGQGRAVQVLGEAEHPSDKGGRPNLLETVVKWEEVTFDGSRVDVKGSILETSKGKDILTLMEGGVMPGVSLRGYGDGKQIKEGSGKVFEVSELHITGFDLVLEPSFENAAEFSESINQSTGDTEMNLEELLKLLREHPEAFAGITEAQIKKMGDEQLKTLEDKVRAALGIGAGENITEALKVMKTKAQQFDESQKKTAVEDAIKEATKELPFGEKMNKVFVESFNGQKFADAEAVKTFAEAQRKQFGVLAAAGLLNGIGFSEGKIQVLGDVLERQTGTPEFGRAAFEIVESIRKSENRAKRAIDQRAESPAAVFTEKALKKFDEVYAAQLKREAREFNEAETTSDLNLPYSVSRAIIAEAYPELVAANIFDFGVMEQSPMNIFYEAFSGETGYTVAVTDEVENMGAEDTWYDLDNKNIVPGTVVVTSNPSGTDYTEGTDYVIDYELGKIRALAAGSINANDVLVDYSYHATRKGEGVAIEQAKIGLTYQTITAAADRLATDITSEAIVFSRSQLGWDAVTRTIAGLIREVRRDIDRRLIEKAVMAALSVASNKTSAWDISDANYGDFVAKIGQAKVKVLNRYYQPTFLLQSVTNADYLSNWDGFKSQGFPNALLNAAGFVGAVKGLPAFASTEMRDTWNLIGNREIVMHRVLQPMIVKGPYPKYSSTKLVAAEQYYTEEYNASLAPIGGKGSIVPVQA